MSCCYFPFFFLVWSFSLGRSLAESGLCSVLLIGIGFEWRWGWQYREISMLSPFGGLTNPSPQVRASHQLLQRQVLWDRVRVEVSKHSESHSWWVVGCLRSHVFAIIYFQKSHGNHHILSLVDHRRSNWRYCPDSCEAQSHVHDEVTKTFNEAHRKMTFVKRSHRGAYEPIHG